MRAASLVVIALLLAGCSQAPEAAEESEPAAPEKGPDAPPVANETGTPPLVVSQNASYDLPTNITRFTWTTQGTGDVVALFDLRVPERAGCTYSYELSGATPDARPAGAVIFDEVIGSSRNPGSVTVGGQTTTVGQASSGGSGAGSRPSAGGEIQVGLMVHGFDETGPQPHDGTLSVECGSPFSITKATASSTLDLYNLANMDSDVAAEVALGGYVAPDSSATAQVSENVTAFVSAGGASVGTWHIIGPGVDQTFDILGTQVYDVVGPAGEWTSQISSQGAYGTGIWGGFYGHGIDFQPEFA